MSQAPILRLRDFTKIFIVETNATDVGISTVLLQDEQPLTYFSKNLGPRMRSQSTYN